MTCTNITRIRVYGPIVRFRRVFSTVVFFTRRRINRVRIQDDRENTGISVIRFTDVGWVRRSTRLKPRSRRKTLIVIQSYAPYTISFVPLNKNRRTIRCVFNRCRQTRRHWNGSVIDFHDILNSVRCPNQFRALYRSFATRTRRIIRKTWFYRKRVRNIRSRNNETSAMAVKLGTEVMSSFLQIIKW